MTRQETKEMFSVTNDEILKRVAAAGDHALRAEGEFIEFGSPEKDLALAEAELLAALELVRKMKGAI